MLTASSGGEDVAAPRRRRIPYVPLCTLLGIVLGWVPLFIHGPHPYKFTVWHFNGAIAVWAFYSARMVIGFMVGLTRWPERWYLRGPMCGFITMFPLSLIALANPSCGPP